MEKRKIFIIVGIVLVVIVAILLLISLLTGGDENPDGSDPSNDNGTSGPVTLEVWGLWESEAVMQPLIEKYQKENSNVAIVYTQKSFTQYEENLYTRLQQGQSVGTPAPDIFRINNTWLSKFQPYLYPAPPTIISNSEYTQTFYPTASADLLGTDNRIYAMPLEIDGLALYYNKEIFERAGINEPPKDWDEMIEVAKKLTVKDSSGNITQAGVAMGTSKNVMHSADILSLLMLQNGAEINQNQNKEVDLTSDRAISAMDFYSDFALVHETWSPDLRTDLEMFYTGKLAMMFAPSWRVFDIFNSNPSVEFGLAPAPVLGSQDIHYGMYWAEAVSKDASNPTEAWKFIKFLTEQQQQKDLYSNSIQIGGRAFGEPYSRKDMASQLEDQAYVGAIIEMAPNMKAWKMGEQAFTEEELRNAITSVSENDMESAQALRVAEENINERLAEIIQ